MAQELSIKVYHSAINNIYKTTIIAMLCHRSFGIDVFDGGKRVRSIPDLSENVEEITELVEMCTELEIDPGQIDYIVEDFLTEFNYD